MKRYLLLCFMACLAVTSSLAQTRYAVVPAARRAAKADSSLAMLQNIITRVWADSLRNLNTKYRDWHYEGADTLTNPYYFMLFSTPTYYDSALHRLFSGSENGNDELLDNISGSLAYVYARSPWLIRNFEENVPGDVEIEMNPYVKPEVKLTNKETKKVPVADDTPFPDLDIEVRKPNFWNFNGSFSFKMTQNYVSDNWYKGGESNLSMLGSMTLQANYDNKQKFSFNNKLEMRIGFQSSKNDKKHRYKSYNDLLRLTNEIKLRAIKNWSYSTMLQSWTQFYPGYRSNDDKVYSDFMSPFESLLTVGMKYELSKKKFKLQLNLSPFASDMKYVDRRALIPNYGLKEGKHTKFEFGSNITANYTWDVIKNVSWQGRVYWYTNYHKTTVECENTIKLRINKYLSTELFLYPRFDDGVKRSDPKDSYFQFKEYLSVGLDVGF